MDIKTAHGGTIETGTLKSNIVLTLKQPNGKIFATVELEPSWAYELSIELENLGGQLEGTDLEDKDAS